MDDLKNFEMMKFVYYDLAEGNRFNFQSRNSVHSYSTRTSTNIALPLPRTNILRYSVFYEGLRLFNMLPDDIKYSPSIARFKFNLKYYLISDYHE